MFQHLRKLDNCLSSPSSIGDCKWSLCDHSCHLENVKPRFYSAAPVTSFPVAPENLAVLKNPKQTRDNCIGIIDSVSSSSEQFKSQQPRDLSVCTKISMVTNAPKQGLK